MNVSNPTDRIQLTEISKLTNRLKVADITKYNMEIIEHALNNSESIKAVKTKLGTGKNQIYALRDKEGNVTTNMDKIFKEAEEFYRDLYSSRDNQSDNGRRISPEGLGFPSLTPEEVNKALDVMQMGKAASAHQVTADLLNDGGQIVLENTGHPVYAMPHDLAYAGIFEEC